VVFDAEYLPRVSEAIREIQTIIKRYTVGLFLQMLIVSTMTILVLSVLEVKYAILLGLVAGVFNIIPYLGISAAAIISTLITFATIGSAKAVFVLLAFAGIHTIDSNIIMPLIVGAKVKINALIAFIGIVLGEMIWGIQGMFLCMPYLAIIKTIFKKIDSMQPWAILLDEDEQASHNPSRFKLIKQIFLRKNSK
jgi:predicted PurR-regulated permease PerM